MPLYSCAIVGTGTDEDPFRPPFPAPWICLGAPGTASGRGLLNLPVASIDARLRKIADDPTERTSLQTRTIWQNEFGITLARPSTASWAELVFEIMREHGRSDGTRWGTLRQSRARSRYEIWLGGKTPIWTAPARRLPSTETFTESWPTNSTTISSGQDQPWTETLNDLEVSSGVLRPTSTAGVQAICTSALDTSDQYHQATFSLTDGGASNNNVQLRVRCADSNNHYRVTARRQSSVSHLRNAEKRVAASNTTLITGDTTDPGASGTIKIELDGSTVTLTIGAYTDTGTDGTPELLTTLTGGLSMISAAGVGQATLDNHTIADVVAAGGFVPFPRPRGLAAGMGQLTGGLV